MMLRGLMMDTPLLISAIIAHADIAHGDQHVVTRLPDDGIARASYRDVHRRARQLAGALDGLRLAEGDRVGSIAWNTQRHLELYFGVSGSGRVMHVINPRLPPEQLAFIINHAGDRALFIDPDFAAPVIALLPKLPSVESVVVMAERSQMPQSCPASFLCYEELIAACSPDFAWPTLDENAAAGLCYTSGTTANPKGVLYSHRSTVLHAMMMAQAGIGRLAENEIVLPVVPMFHVMAWGFPYACPMTGAGMVMPGRALDGDSLFALMDAENVTMAAGVPTIWAMLLATMRRHGRAPGALSRTLVGGAALPVAMIKAFEEFGVEVCQGWGMTETSPVGSLSTLKPAMRDWPRERRLAQKARQGRPVFGVELEIVGEDGRALAHDGAHHGALRIRGPWVCSAYFSADGGAGAADPAHAAGWFDTGDIATIDEHGYIGITDRSKDLIKSGGEWISSIQLENLAIAHPDIAQAAAIAVADEKWGERPLLVAVAAEGRRPDKRSILDHLSAGLARWQLPDDIVFVDALPIGATGKVLKAKLRERFAGSP